MTDDKINKILVEKTKYLPKDSKTILSRIIENLNKDNADVLNSIKFKKPIHTLLYSIFLGFAGFDRLYLKSYLYAAIKLLTIGGFLLWWIADCFTAINRTKKYNYEILMNTLINVKLSEISYKG